MFYFCIRKPIVSRLAFFIMKKIALISDTHGLLAQDVLEHIETADEVWHAGDIGHIDLVQKLESLKPLRAVYGNIDDHTIRYSCPLNLNFECEGMKVFMTHIGGYPGRYSKRVRELLDVSKPDIYICGHSHICKVMKDHQRNLIHLNPGACGIKGFHQIRTMILLEIDDSSIKRLQIVELGKRSDAGIK